MSRKENTPPGGGDDRQAAAERLATMWHNVPRPPEAVVRGPSRVAAPAAATAAPPRQWEVRGAFRESGKEAVLIITAPTQSAAEHEAVQNGLLVESCWPAQQAPQSPPSPPPPAQGPMPLGYAPPYLPPPPPPFGQPYVLIEQTSKRYKWQILAGSLLAIFGIFSGCLFVPLAAGISNDMGALVLVLGILCFFGGLGWAVVAKLSAWWHHG